jgi:hypothetical protein
MKRFRLFPWILFLCLHTLGPQKNVIQFQDLKFLTEFLKPYAANTVKYLPIKKIQI